MRKKRFRMVVISVTAMVLSAMIFYIAWGNTALQLNAYTVTGENLPEAFDGFRIVQISDLHNAEMGKNHHNLISLIKEAEPNIIVITGDLIDSRRTNVEKALDFAEQAVKIAPCYYVTGNHESRVDAYKELQEGLIALGVTVLENERTEIEYQGEKIALLGVKDPAFQTDISSYLKKLKNEDDGYTVLLSHRPELFDLYVANEIDLVFSGHAHGGQFRLPLIGGLYAPNQGIFPEYDGGLYTEGNTNMIVSRGIGNSLFPFRFHNRPEVVLMEFKS